MEGGLTRFERVERIKNKLRRQDETRRRKIDGEIHFGE
jgi:hypothetical protein